MPKTSFERMCDYETTVVELERIENLLTLLYEEIDEAYLASVTEETWRAIAHCKRSSISETLVTNVAKSISEIKVIMKTLIKEGI